MQYLIDCRFLPLEAFAVLVERKMGQARLEAVCPSMPLAFLAQLTLESSLAFVHSLDAIENLLKNKIKLKNHFSFNWVTGLCEKLVQLNKFAKKLKRK